MQTQDACNAAATSLPAYVRARIERLVGRLRMGLLQAVVTVLVLLPQPAPAQPGPTLYIGYASLEPQAPVAGQPVTLRFWTGPCVGIIDDPDDTDITLDGSTITFILDGSRRTNPTFCQFPYFHHSYPVGSYSAGTYTLIAQLRYRNFFNQEVLETFGTLNFEVMGEPQPPERVPGPGWHGLWLLFLGVLLLAARRMRTRTLLSLSLLVAGINNSMPVLAQPEALGRLHVLLSADVDPDQIVAAWRDGTPLSKPDLPTASPS